MTLEYLPRSADALISELAASFPALLISGPRAAGKTTTAARHTASELRLDRPGDAALVRADPDAALRSRSEPILIDEWQLVPEVLAAVKRAVDTDRRPGRFLITGSVHGRLDSPTWPGTGRLIHVRMGALTARETLRRDLSAPSFIATVATHGIAGLALPDDRPDLRGYLELAIMGGFPEPVLDHHSENTRIYWSANYVNELFTRDIQQLDSRRDIRRLSNYFRAYALNTAGVTALTTLVDAAQVDRRTAEAYEQLLTDLYIVDAVPAWATNRLKRLVKTPKRYVCDTGLAAGTLGLTIDGILGDHDQLGRILDTFVAAQLRSELDLAIGGGTLYHLREQNGRREVDLLIELTDNRVIGIEIKANSAPGDDSARHLRWLRDELGDRFAGGIVLHTGHELYPLGDRIVAAPICTLWV